MSKSGIYDKQWLLRYQELKDYYKKHGHSQVSVLDDEDPVLGRWVARQRHAYKTNQLSPERRELLDYLNFNTPVIRQWPNPKPITLPI